MNIANEIKRQLSMDEVARRYGFTPNRGGFIACPFHREKTPSLKIYKEPGRGWNCYGCGEGGSVIDFTMALFNIPFSAAVVRLNADFNLGLSNERPDPKEIRRLKDERLAAQREADAWEAEYMAKTYEYRRLWLAKKLKAPKTPDEPFGSEFAEALKKLDEMDWWFVTHPYKRGDCYQ